MCVCVCFILMSVKQEGKHCTDGERGWETGSKTVSDVQMLFFLLLRGASMLRKKFSTQKHNDPLQVDGMRTKKKMFLKHYFWHQAQKKKKSSAKIQIHILIIPIKRNSVMNMHPKLEAILNA